MIDTVLVDLKNTKIRACIARREDGTFLTIINARIAKNAAYEAYAHELRHIRGGDFDKFDANRIEVDAHAHKKT